MENKTNANQAEEKIPAMQALLENPFLLLFIGVAVPTLFYQNTGWVQFGYRFSLDFLPLLFVLLAIGLRRITPLLKAAIVLSWLVNLWGVVWWFGRFY